MNLLNVPVIRYVDEGSLSTDNQVAIEEPLEIYINGMHYYTTMRLPGEEIPLAAGLCFTEGIVHSMDDMESASYCSDTSKNKINIFLSEERRKEKTCEGKIKHSTAYSSCGICGADMIEDVSKTIERIEKKTRIDFKTLVYIQEAFFEKQDVFRATGGTHAAGIFNMQGTLLSFAEDVGRHNALDKAIGKLLIERKIHEASIVLLSSRLSYEMVMKSAKLGVEILGGVSTATSLAVGLADSAGITLIGFLRGNNGNVYTHPERLTGGNK